MDSLLADVEENEPRLACLLGNEAIVRGALEAGVAFACGYPGTPSSEVTDSFARVAAARGVTFEYSVNEKVALEMAFAASLAGARAICAMKHLGLMVAGDPLSTIPYVGVVGGLVVVSAGDPSCLTSPNEQDQRHLGAMLHLPTLDPSTPQEACAMTRRAFEISEASALPVLLRITTRVAHCRAVVRCGPLEKPRVGGFIRDPTRFVPIPVNARRLRREIGTRLEIARRETADLFQRSGYARKAILAAGVPAATCGDLLRQHELEDQVILATLGAVYPLPEEELVTLLREVDRILVVEELSPLIEDAVRALGAVHGLRTEILGKRTGHLPIEFEYVPEIIQRGLHEAFNLGPPPAAPASAPQVPPRPPVLCPGCPHRATFFAARAAFGDDHLYFNDIGCYTLGYGAPLHCADALLSMGAGFTLAAGVSRVTGQRTVGFVGDSTFFHAAMPGLLNAIKEDVNMVAVILDNEVTAMTGFQPSPHRHADRHRASIEAVVRALGAGQVETVDPTDLAATVAAFERARDASGTSVVVARHPCPTNVARKTGAAPHGAVRYEIDHRRCRHCGRESLGLRCAQGITPPFERQMARSRVLETTAGEGPEPVAPCATRCPLGLCIQGYAKQVAAGQYREALDLVMSGNPLPDSVCRVCHRPCEELCVYATRGESVAINDLKRFVMDWAAGPEGVPYEPRCESLNGMKVAVAGAGPAGLAAAHELRLRGYEVTLFDGGHQPGGLLRTGIPQFRLPPEALDRDVERILGLGIEFVGNTVLGRDRQLGELLATGYDAVFLGLGAQRALPLTVDKSPAGSPAVIDALAYLARTRAGDATTVGGRVVVVGGGNAAIDAARTAVRHGAHRVIVAYRRGREEMPALAEEITAAEHEGIALETHLQPVAIVPEGLRCLRTELGAPDASGRRRPVPIPGSELMIAADRVIVAIGQASDPGFLVAGDPPLKTADDGTLIVDPETAQTSHPRIFAGGDLVGGPRTVTDAMAWGRRAAWGIDVRLRGRETADRRPPPPRPGAWPAPSPRRSRTDAGRRERPAELACEERTAGFEEVVGGLSEVQARAEAARCAVCGQCGNCRACIDLFGCPAFYLEDDLIRINPGLCNGCGVCARFCPNRAIIPMPETEG